MTAIDRNVFETLFVDSGIFDNPVQKQVLEDAGVRIIRGFLENVEEIYQMADAYLFPTKSGDYVISVPLSVMESLACGTAAVAYEAIQSKESITEALPDAIVEVTKTDELNDALTKAAAMKSESSLLNRCMSWADSADYVEKIITEM